MYPEVNSIFRRQSDHPKHKHQSKTHSKVIKVYLDYQLGIFWLSRSTQTIMKSFSGNEKVSIKKSSRIVKSYGDYMIYSELLHRSLLDCKDLRSHLAHKQSVNSIAKLKGFWGHSKRGFAGLPAPTRPQNIIQ